MTEADHAAISPAQLAADLKRLLPKREATLDLMNQQIPGTTALCISGGPEPPQTDAEAKERLDLLWGHLRRLMDTKLQDEIARSEIFSEEATVEACVEAAKRIFRASKRIDGWKCSEWVDNRSLTELRKDADKLLRPVEDASSRKYFEEHYEWPILCALARLLLNVERECQGEPAATTGIRKHGKKVSIALGFLVVGIAILVSLITSSGGSREVLARNPAGEIGRVLSPIGPLDDLAIADQAAWTVSSKGHRAYWRDEAREEFDEFIVDLPNRPVKLPPGSENKSISGGYRITAGDWRAWVMNANGAIDVLRPDSRFERHSVTPLVRLNINATAIEYVADSLWVAGLNGKITRLNAYTGAVEQRYRLPSSVGVTSLVSAHGSIWALDYDQLRVFHIQDGSSGVAPAYLDPQVYTLTLDRPARMIASGYGGLWVVHWDGTVALYNLTNGKTDFLRVPGKAVSVAVSVGAAWVALEDSTIVRMEATGEGLIGQPIELPEPPIAVAADFNPWVITRRSLVEILADASEKPA